MAGEVETARAGAKPSASASRVAPRGLSEPDLRLIGRIRRTARTIPIVAVSASILAALGLVQILAGSAVHAAALAPAALAARLDILAEALDAVPEAQLVVAADGRAVFANVAFQRLFPGKGETALEDRK